MPASGSHSNSGGNPWHEASPAADYPDVFTPDPGGAGATLPTATPPVTAPATAFSAPPGGTGPVEPPPENTVPLTDNPEGETQDNIGNDGEVQTAANAADGGSALNDGNKPGTITWPLPDENRPDTLVTDENGRPQLFIRRLNPQIGWMAKERNLSEEEATIEFAVLFGEEEVYVDYDANHQTAQPNQSQSMGQYDPLPLTPVRGELFDDKASGKGDAVTYDLILDIVKADPSKAREMAEAYGNEKSIHNAWTPEAAPPIPVEFDESDLVELWGQLLNDPDALVHIYEQLYGNPYLTPQNTYYNVWGDEYEDAMDRGIVGILWVQMKLGESGPYLEDVIEERYRYDVYASSFERRPMGMPPEALRSEFFAGSRAQRRMEAEGSSGNAGVMGLIV